MYVIGTYISIFVMVCIIIYLIFYIHEIQNQKIQLEHFISQQQEYFSHMLQTEEDTKKFRHDILNHLLELHFYCQERQYEKVFSYLESLIGDVSTLRQMKYTVGNDVVDVLLNYYLLPLEPHCDIRVTGRMAECCSVTQTDLCTLISNLLKNAVEAVRHADNKSLSVCVQQGRQYLRIEVANTYAAPLRVASNGNILTSKEDKRCHGYGLLNIKHVVKKYHGTYEPLITKNTFRTKIFIKI